MRGNVSTALGLTTWAEAEINVPIQFIRRRPKSLDANGDVLSDYMSVHHSDETILLLGDISLIGRFRIINARLVPNLIVDIRTGVAYSTTNIGLNPADIGQIGHVHESGAFLDNGTFNPIVGLETFYNFDGWSLYGWVSTKTALYDNKDEYRAPNQITSGLGAASGFGLKQWEFQLGSTVYYEATATWSGKPAQNSGRTSIIATANVRFVKATTWDASLSLLVPWDVQVAGDQIDTPLFLAMDINYHHLLW